MNIFIFQNILRLFAQVISKVRVLTAKKLIRVFSECRKPTLYFLLKIKRNKQRRFVLMNASSVTVILTIFF